jgi:hypothetical protein
MNSYKTSNGERITKEDIDVNIKKAKARFYDDTLFMKGWIACEQCGKSSGEHIDISHIISVKHAQDTGRSELAYSTKNLQWLCRTHHIEFDNKTNMERELIYQKKNNL